MCAAVAFYGAGDYVPEDSVGYLMRRVLTMVAHEVERQLEASDLTNAQWVPLLKLFMGRASTVAELARECQLDAGAMTRLLDRLEAKGLCRRVRSLADRRVVNIELTAEGRLAAAGIPEVLSRVQNAHLAGFTVEEFETLKGLLRRILENGLAQSATRIISGGAIENQ
jgi:DNA-binding MarR family transcriptional regulator